MSVLITILGCVLVMIGFITNVALWTPVNLGTVAVDICCLALYGWFAVRRRWLNETAVRRLRFPLVISGVFSVWCIYLALTGSNGLWERVMGVRNNVFYFGVWIILAFSAVKLPVRRVLNTVWYCGLVVCVLAIVQAYCHEAMPEELLTLKACGQHFSFAGTNIFRVTGLVGTPQIFAGFSSFMVLLGWMRSERERRFIDKVLILVPLYAMYLTYTRTANVALLLSWGVAWTFWAAIPIWRRVVRAVVVIAALLFLLFGTLQGSQELRDFGLQQHMGGVESTFLRSLAGHVECWHSGFRALLGLNPEGAYAMAQCEKSPCGGATTFASNPLKRIGRAMRGLGMGSQGCSARDYSFTYATDGAYCAYLLETGLVGLLLMFALVLWFAVSLIKRFRQLPRGGEQYRVVGLILLTGLYFGMSSLLDSSILARTNFILFWMLVGFAYCEPMDRVVVGRPKAKGMSRALRLKLDQIHVLIAKDFKLKYNATALGFLWSLLVPMFTSIVYYFVFGIMMRWDAHNYLLYLMSGTFLWQFFANVIIMNGGALMGNAGLLKKTSFDRELLIRSTFYTESIHFLLTVPILFGMMAFYHVSPQWLTVLPNLVVCMVSLMLFSVGISYAYAAWNLYFRDLERIMNIVIMMWMFCSPVFIPVSNVPEKYRWIYDLNPAAAILNLWRDIFYEPAWHPERCLNLLLISLAMFFVGRFVFRKMEPGFAEMM